MFVNKVALVTGASSGIGRACAERLREEGAWVITAQRREAKSFESICTDLSDPLAADDVISKVIAKAGCLDVLVNNAGLMLEGTVEEMSLDDWNATLALNLTTPFLLMKHAMPYLKAANGAIVNIGSIEGLGSNPRHPAYCAAKAGLHGLTRAVAVDHGADCVRCNAVAPGWIDTDLNVAFAQSVAHGEDFQRQLEAIHPLRRTGSVEEVANLVCWLASEQAAFITGQVFTVDGGRTAKLSLPQ